MTEQTDSENQPTTTLSAIAHAKTPRNDTVTLLLITLYLLTIGIGLISFTNVL